MKTQRPSLSRSRARAIISILVLVGGLAAAYLRYERPLPPLRVSLMTPASVITPVALPWTASGESAISTASGQILGEGTNANKSVPIASIAKLITILTVLKKFPISAGQTGPTIILSQSDVDRDAYYTAIDGSSVPVQDGEHITEYQMLQAMMLPSANNIADSLAVWAYGSLGGYRAAAEGIVSQLGMRRTIVGSDASGFLPDTTSTASDLMLLAQAALKESVITEIASQRSAVIPVAGTIYNTNPDLGLSGVTGLKTGTTDQAGDCFLFSATHTFENGQTESFVGTILNAPTSQTRYSEAIDLLTATYQGYKDVLVAKAGQHVGAISSDWGSKTDITPISDVSQFLWSGRQATSSLNVSVKSKIALSKNEAVGTIASGRNHVTIATTSALDAPSIWWRIVH